MSLNKPLVLLGEARGEHEERLQTSFVGASGIELLRMLNEAGVIELTEVDHRYLSKFYQSSDNHLIDSIWRLHPEIHRTNVFQQHPPGNKLEAFCGPKSEGLKGFGPLLQSKFVRKEFAFELERLGDELLTVDPNLVVCLGNTALWALTGAGGITKHRGTTRLSTHCAADFKLLSTFHPAAVLRQWELRPTTIIDLMKASREREFPEIRRPQRLIWIEPTLTDLEDFYQKHIRNCPLLCVDIENPGGPISEIGFGTKEVALVIPFIDKRKKDKCYWRSITEERKALEFVRRVLEDIKIKKLLQNGIYDLAVIWRWWGIRVFGFEHDTMLEHHALQPESLKGLGFLASIYTDLGAWKNLRKMTNTFKKDS